MNILPWHVWVGLAGVALVLLAHFLLQIRKINGIGTTYQLMNALGALGVVVSLIVANTNLVAILLALIWCMISVYGVVFGFRSRGDTRKAHRDDPW